uniref:Uncharacterized protein n=1 Tax=Oryza punctata TaxID=4537 RepID=A0A0E0JPG9_ORYPU
MQQVNGELRSQRGRRFKLISDLMHQAPYRRLTGCDFSVPTSTEQLVCDIKEEILIWKAAGVITTSNDFQLKRERDKEKNEKSLKAMLTKLRHQHSRTNTSRNSECT